MDKKIASIKSDNVAVIERLEQERDRLLHLYSLYVEYTDELLDKLGRLKEIDSNTNHITNKTKTKHTSEVAPCECGGLGHMFELYNGFLTGKTVHCKKCGGDFGCGEPCNEAKP